MSEISIKIVNLSKIRAAFKKSPELMVKDLNIAIRSSILHIAGKSASNAPVKSGNLRASHFRPESLEFKNLYGKLEPSPKYSAWVHDGTGLLGPRGHPIEPKNKRVLATSDDPGWGSKNKKGYYIIGTYSRGQEANPFLKKAVDSEQRQVNKFFRKAVDDTLQSIAESSK